VIQRILKDSTDAIIVYPDLRRERVGKASVAEVRIGTPNNPLPADDAWQAATVDAVNANTNAAAAKGATSLAFASDPTVTAGRLYLLELATGQRITVRAIDTGTTVTLADPLPMAVPSGTPLKGIAITHALVAAETLVMGLGVVMVKATIGGVVYKWDETFRIVRAEFLRALSPAYLVNAYPSMAKRGPDNDDDLTETIDAAFENTLVGDLMQSGIHVDRINTPSALFPAWADACFWRVQRDTKGGADADVIAAKVEYEANLAKALLGKDTWYDVDDENSLPGDEADHKQFQVVRFGR
jgi:hypothetical protein